MHIRENFIVQVCVMKIICQIRHLTLLIVMVSFAECFPNSIKMCGDGVGLDWHDENMLDLNEVRPRKVRIYFYKDKIHYFFNKMMHHYTHTHIPTVKYIYHLMSLMDHVSWMKAVLKKVYINEVKSLQDMCFMKCPQQCVMTRWNGREYNF